MRTKEPLKGVKALLTGKKFSPVLLTELAVRLLLGGVLSQGLILNGHAPFSLGYVAASGSGIGGFAALLGTILGYWLGMDGAGMLRYGAAAILIYAVEFAFFDLTVYKEQWFMPVCSGVITGITGFVYLSGSGWNPTAVMEFLSELLLVGVSCFLFQGLLKGQNPPNPEGLLFLCCGLGVSVARFTSIGGNFFGAMITLLTARGGAGVSAVSGGVMGLAVGLTQGGTPLLGGILACSGAITGQARGKQGRLGTVLLFGASSLLAVAWTGGGLALAIPMGGAAVVYSVLPEKLLRRVDGYTCRPQGTSSLSVPVQPTPSAAKAQFLLEEQAAAFRSLYEHISEQVLRGEPPESSTIIFDRVSERVCARCSHYQICWRREHISTCQALSQALNVMLDRGHGEMKDFPSQFRSRCMRLDEFVQAANEELYRYWNRQQYRARLQNNRAAVCRQYAQLSALLDTAASRLAEEQENDPSGAAAAERAVAKLGIQAQCVLTVDSRGRRTLELRGRGLSSLNSEEGSQLFSQTLGVRMEPTDVFRVRQGLRLVFQQSPPLSATVAVASRQKEENRPSGDNGIWFRDDKGILWVVLCDGMGSGEGAAGESRLMLTLLKDFLHAGVEPMAALTTLTGALSLRGEVDGGFTTVDLLRLDLFTGNTELFKLGGAPTYLRRGEGVSRVTGTTLPAGLELDKESKPDVTRFRLGAEDFVLMVTDGITDGDEDAWLRQMLGQYHGESPRELAQGVLASPGAGREDDRTVVALRLSNRA